MKKLSFFLMVMLMSIMSFAAETKIEGDGTFDKPIAGRLGQFNVNQGNSKGSEFKKITDEKHGSCLYVKTPANKSGEFFLYQHVPVVKGKSTVKISMMIKGKGAITLCNYGYDQAKKYKMYRRLKGMNANIRINAPDWKVYNFEYNTSHIDENVKYIFLVFVVHKNSELTFDNFSGTVSTAE